MSDSGAAIRQLSSRVSTTEEHPVSGSRLAVALTAPRSALYRYGLALVLSVVALILTRIFEQPLSRVVFVLFWPAVLLSGLVGGIGPAALASLFAVLAVDWFIVSPGSLDSTDFAPLSVFFVAAILMSSVADALRRARTRAVDVTLELRDTALQLEQQAIELEHQLEESQSLQEELEQTSEELALRTQEAEDAERFTRGILDSISDPFVVQDADWRFQYINRGAEESFRAAGRGDAGTLIGRRLWEVYPDLIGTEFEREMRRAATERVPVTFEASYREGRWSVLSCYPLPNGGLATQWKDVTARRRAEEAAHYLARASDVLASSLDYETTLSEIAHLVVPELAEWCSVELLDEEGTLRQVAIAHVDPDKIRWARELGERYPADRNAATGVPQVLRTGEPALYRQISDEMLVAAATDAEHLRILREIGFRSALIVPLIARGRVLGAFTMVTVRSGREYGDDDQALAMELARRAALAVDNARLHRDEQRAHAQADEANRAKMQFLAVMSHELRTPLNAIGGYAELMHMGLRGEVTEEQKQDLDRITLNQRNLLGLINDILNFAKIDAGHVELRCSHVPVAPLLADVESVVAPQLRLGGLSLVSGGCDEKLTMYADSEKVRQILLNLVSNALKFTEPGGTLTLACGRQDHNVFVSVRDTGIGIAEDRIDSVFDPFVQLDRTLTSHHQGTGLGLAISRDLARAMGGDIVATSEPGRGSTFTLILPGDRP